MGQTTLKKTCNEYQHDSVQKSLRPCALDKSSLSIGRVRAATGDRTVMSARYNGFNQFLHRINDEGNLEFHFVVTCSAILLL